MRHVRLAGLLLIAATGLGCRPKPPAAPRPNQGPLTPATVPAEQPASFDGPGIKLSYPPSWVPTPSEAYVLVLASPGGSSAHVSLDVPKLPPHIPGLIPLGLVVNGYVDDLKAQRPGIAVGEPADVKVAGARGGRVRSAWEADGETFVEEAVLTVHGDRVYIFRADAEAADEAAAHDALDRLLASVQWK